VRSLIREDIDTAAEKAFTYQSFLSELKRMGYEIKRGENVKHPAIKPPGGTRFIRLSSLGEQYTEDAVKRRLAEKRTHKPTEPEIKPVPARKRYTVRRKAGRYHRGKLRGFRTAYIRYLYLLGGRGQYRRVPFSTRQEVIKLHRYQAQFRLLQSYHIDTGTQLDMLTDALQAEIDAETERRKGFYELKRKGVDMTPEIDAINQRLRDLRRELRLCMQVEENIPRIKGEFETVRKQTQQRNSEKRKEESEYGHQR